MVFWNLVIIWSPFGGAGYFFRKLEFEPGPLILAFVLGAISERAFRQSLLMSKGNPSIFFSRPISCVLMVILLALVALQVFFMVKKKTKSVDQFRGAG